MTEKKYKLTVEGNYNTIKSFIKGYLELTTNKNYIDYVALQHLNGTRKSKIFQLKQIFPYICEICDKFESEDLDDFEDVLGDRKCLNCIEGRGRLK